jgi:GNAT superfamily N-acetyltransferase
VATAKPVNESAQPKKVRGGSVPRERPTNDGSAPPAARVSTRPPAVSDAERIAELLTVLGYPSTATEVVERLRVIGSHPGFASWVAEADGHVVGFVGACTAPAFEKNGVYGRILALVVDASARGLGIGRALVDVAERWMLERGAGEVFVHSGNHRAEAHDFYRRLGYEATGFRFKKVL